MQKNLEKARDPQNAKLCNALNIGDLQYMVITVNGKISAPLGAPYNWRPFGAPIFRFIFVGNFIILFFFVKKNKTKVEVR